MDRGIDETIFQRLAEFSPVGMVVHAEAVIRWANDAAARTVGLEKGSELVGRPVIEFVAPRSRGLVAERARHLLATGQSLPGAEEWFLHRDGREVPVEVDTALVGERMVLVVIRDVSTRKRAEERYRALFDDVPVGVWEEDLSGVKRCIDALRASGVVDLAAHFRAHPGDLVVCAQQVRILDVNQTACSMLGARNKEDLVANLHKVFLPESMEDFAAEVLQLAAGAHHTVTDGWNGTLDGGRRWVGVRAALVQGHEHDWSRVLVTTTDLTERRELAERLQRVEKLEAVTRLAGGIAHDFNNILAAVLGLSELSLEDAAPGTALHENQLQIREASLRARDLVRQILTLGRRDHPRPQPLDVAHAVREALEHARRCTPPEVSFESHLDPHSGVTLVDPLQLQQVVTNLCTNARDATRPGGHIEVDLRRVLLAAPDAEVPAGDWIRLRVHDDGVGMDAQLLARLFEPYLTTKATTGGHGLGLAVVHGIVTGLGGAIRVRSAPGKGSTFEVFLPRALQPSEALPSPGAPPRGHEHVLVVDDEELVRVTHRRVLQSLGYQVTEAAGAEEALRLLRADPGRFAVVLTDQSMPGGTSGTDFARAWLAEKPSARIVLCTGFSDEVDDARARRMGLRALLAKPIPRAVLATTLRRVLDEP